MPFAAIGHQSCTVHAGDGVVRHVPEHVFIGRAGGVIAAADALRFADVQARFRFRKGKSLQRNALFGARAEAKQCKGKGQQQG